MELKKQVDVCVVGAGHAGCEAALACARLGMKTVIFTVSVDSIALMPCNPNVGGSSKGHLVRSESWQYIPCGHRRTRRNIPEPCVKCWKIRKIF